MGTRRLTEADLAATRELMAAGRLASAIHTGDLAEAVHGGDLAATLRGDLSHEMIKAAAHLLAAATIVAGPSATLGVGTLAEDARIAALDLLQDFGRDAQGDPEVQP